MTPIKIGYPTKVMLFGITFFLIMYESECSEVAKSPNPFGQSHAIHCSDPLIPQSEYYIWESLSNMVK